MAEEETSVMLATAADAVRRDRTIKKYECILYMLSCLHYAWTAHKPHLTYKKSKKNQALIEKCSLLVEKYHPTWYLFNNGHFHTIMLAKYENHPKIEYERQMVPLSDGGVVSLDWALRPCDSRSEINTIDVPTIVIFHGLTGGSRDNYVCVTVEKLLCEGWRVVVMNARGCADNPVLTPGLFCGAYTNDVREAINLLRTNHVKKSPLIAVGFSLGSNIMVKYVGEEGDQCQLNAAISVGNPYDFMCNSRNMNFSFIHNTIYNGALADNLKRLVFERSNAHEQLVSHPQVNLEELKSAARVSDFDELLTRRVFGYASVSDYYRDASCSQYLKHVKIPLLLLTAEDDPVCIHRAIPYDDVIANENVILAVTKTGGHLGFFTGNNLFEMPDMWSSNVVVQFCNAIEEMNEGKISFMRKLFQSIDCGEEIDTIGNLWKGDVDKEDHTGEDHKENDEISLSKLAGVFLGLVALRLALKHRHLMRKKWWY